MVAEVVKTAVDKCLKAKWGAYVGVLWTWRRLLIRQTERHYDIKCERMVSVKA
jgi:hypothetical protein